MWQGLKVKAPFWEPGARPGSLWCWCCQHAQKVPLSPPLPQEWHQGSPLGCELQQPLAVWSSLELVSLLSLLINLSSPGIRYKLLIYGSENLQPYLSWKMLAVLRSSRFKKITDNKSSTISFVYKLVSPFPIFPDTFYSVIYIPRRSKAF